jgi:hypothetical protein
MGSGMTQLAKWLLNQGLNRWFVLFFTLSLKIIIIFFGEHHLCLKFQCYEFKGIIRNDQMSIEILEKKTTKHPDCTIARL